MSLASDADNFTIPSRKRSRHEYSVESNATLDSVIPDWSNGMEAGDSMARSNCRDPGSPVPFVNTKYQLAGGLDTPSAAAAHEVDQSEYSEIAYRIRLSGEVNESDENMSYLAQNLATRFTDSNGRPRIQSSTPQQEGWSKLAFDVVGNVVGKIWEFCKAGAFRGFTAGGGKPYGIQSEQPSTPIQRNSWRDEGEQQAVIFGERRDRESTPVPGQSTNEGFALDYKDSDRLESTPPRATKRRQLEKNDGDIAHNWVMVRNSGSGKRKRTRPAPQVKMPAWYSMQTASSTSRHLRPIANSRRPTVSSRASVPHAGSPSPNPARPASFASLRSPGGSRIPVPSNSSPTLPKNTAVATVGGMIGVGSQRYGLVSTAGTVSPASAEVQRWAAKRRQEEKKADEGIRKINAQLEAMIRQGKEALGTKVEVELYDTEELSVEDLVDDGLQGHRYQDTKTWM